MSASMVRKSLAVVDADFRSRKDKKNKGNSKVIKDLIPENHKIIRKITRKGQKEKVDILKPEAKVTIDEIRKTHRSKEKILKDNLKILKSIQEACAIDLDKEITKQLIERAVAKRPVRLKTTTKKEKKTAFTEEDFAKFEAEYFDE